ncbi:hypothetical protein DC363_02440 [Thalassorhabdomicrobium marinisediminis]|uniref:Uncharacterized protein n=2 Tax=Thalassorhabdomicrobium marinisediminis TaxID=2170577 RepID=A0A2T7FZC2_9RHOB|nr:hypothetical protein DC363_02440 [Thalassorhabdomicrobium marinisediminis]
MHAVSPRDSLDRVAFILAFAAGTVGSITLKMLNIHPFGVAVFAAIILCGYALTSWFSGKLMLEPEVLGDNCYYLGFLFTLASLGYTLYQVAAPGQATAQTDLLPEVISGFGVALSSTIVGVFLRVLLMQIRPDIMVRDRETRRELQDQVRDFRVALSESVQDIRTFSTESIQMAVEREAKIAESINVAVKRAEGRIAESSGIITDTLKYTVERQSQTIFEDISKAVGDSTKTAVEEMQVGLTKIGESAKSLSEAHIGALEEQRDNAAKTQESLAAIEDSLSSLSKSLRTLDDDLRDVPITKSMASFKGKLTRSTNDLARLTERISEVSENVEADLRKAAKRNRHDAARLDENVSPHENATRIATQSDQSVSHAIAADPKAGGEAPQGGRPILSVSPPGAAETGESSSHPTLRADSSSTQRSFSGRRTPGDG